MQPGMLWLRYDASAPSDPSQLYITKRTQYDTVHGGLSMSASELLLNMECMSLSCLISGLNHKNIVGWLTDTSDHQQSKQVSISVVLALAVRFFPIPKQHFIQCTPPSRACLRSAASEVVFSNEARTSGPS